MTSPTTEQLIEEAVSDFKKEFTKIRGGEITWLRGIMPGEIEKFLTEKFSLIASASVEGERNECFHDWFIHPNEDTRSCIRCERVEIAIHPNQRNKHRI